MHAAAPMWRNGRRNGLKIRSREKRGMGSTPIIGISEMRIMLGDSLGFSFSLVANCRARKRTKTLSIRQVADEQIVRAPKTYATLARFSFGNFLQ